MPIRNGLKEIFLLGFNLGNDNIMSANARSENGYGF